LIFGLSLRSSLFFKELEAESVSHAGDVVAYRSLKALVGYEPPEIAGHEFRLLA